jgi:putative colanic acid biosynthesis UDP-glucose lipid carrier transferase
MAHDAQAEVLLEDELPEGSARAARGAQRKHVNAETLVSLAPQPLPIGNRVVASRPLLINCARAVGDPLIVMLALLAVSQFEQIAADDRLVSFAMVTFIVLLAGSVPGRSTVSRSTLSSILRLALVVGALLFAAHQTGYLRIRPGRWVIEWAMLTAFAIIASHRAMDHLAPLIAPLHTRRRVAAIVGTTLAGRELAAQFMDDAGLNTEFLGFFEDRNAQRVGAAMGRVVGAVGDLIRFAKEGRVDVVYIALPMTPQPRMLRVLNELRDTTSSVYFVPDIFMMDFVQAWPSDVNGIPVLAVCETPFGGINDLVKRATDVILASALLIALSPLMLAIAWGVSIGSPGPIIFRQRRYGMDGKEIMVWKFRSMTVTQDGDTIPQAQRGDARVTRFGALLRKLSLDELPQLVNVLQGRMSLVGPRPHAVAHNEMYRKLVDGYMLRHKVRPGITGLAQVNGCRGETDSVAKMRRRLEYDLMYLRSWSLQLDIYIILKTMVLMWKDPASY